ncbi:MAG: hypothetical protein HKN68_21385 [Saprospiraceae bacterium]|nr:hypothetical protein [Saprospiraceae bacterium]
MLSIMIVFTAFSCKNKSNPEVEGVTIPEDFYPFYDRFHNDSLYQMDHIIFPLTGEPAEETLKGQEWTWPKEDWVMHKPFDDKGTFKRDWYAINSVIVEKISDSSGRFTMERRWAKMGGEWNLIYYKEMGI